MTEFLARENNFPVKTQGIALSPLAPPGGDVVNLLSMT
jgi:hypothetical protein